MVDGFVAGKPNVDADAKTQEYQEPGPSEAQPAANPREDPNTPEYADLRTTPAVDRDVTGKPDADAKNQQDEHPGAPATVEDAAATSTITEDPVAGDAQPPDISDSLPGGKLCEAPNPIADGNLGAQATVAMHVAVQPEANTSTPEDAFPVGSDSHPNVLPGCSCKHHSRRKFYSIGITTIIYSGVGRIGTSSCAKHRTG